MPTLMSLAREPQNFDNANDARVWLENERTVKINKLKNGDLLHRYSHDPKILQGTKVFSIYSPEFEEIFNGGEDLDYTYTCASFPDGLVDDFANITLEHREEIIRAQQNNGYQIWGWGYGPYLIEPRNNRAVVFAEVSNNGFDLRYADPEFQADREIVLAAVSRTGLALEYAAPELKADREIVLAAVDKNANALEYAAPELKADKEVVRAALNCKMRYIKNETFQHSHLSYFENTKILSEIRRKNAVAAAKTFFLNNRHNLFSAGAGIGAMTYLSNADSKLLPEGQHAPVDWVTGVAVATAVKAAITRCPRRRH